MLQCNRKSEKTNPLRVIVLVPSIHLRKWPAAAQAEMCEMVSAASQAEGEPWLPLLVFLTLWTTTLSSYPSLSLAFLGTQLKGFSSPSLISKGCHSVPASRTPRCLKIQLSAIPQQAPLVSMANVLHPDNEKDAEYASVSSVCTLALKLRAYKIRTDDSMYTSNREPLGPMGCLHGRSLV
jgi:hypothetical protein